MSFEVLRSISFFPIQFIGCDNFNFIYINITTLNINIYVRASIKKKHRNNPQILPSIQYIVFFFVVHIKLYLNLSNSLIQSRSNVAKTFQSQPNILSHFKKQYDFSSETLLSNYLVEIFSIQSLNIGIRSYVL